MSYNRILIYRKFACCRFNKLCLYWPANTIAKLCHHIFLTLLVDCACHCHLSSEIITTTIKDNFWCQVGPFLVVEKTAVMYRILLCLCLTFGITLNMLLKLKNNIVGDKIKIFNQNLFFFSFRNFCIFEFRFRNLSGLWKQRILVLFR